MPQGGAFVAGTGMIGSTANGTLNITQSSTRGVINWNSFSIGAGGHVNIDNGSGATLNRVTGTSLSTVSGTLSSTGSVYLINPNGVVVGPGGKVLTQGDFVASTRDISTGAFMAGGNLTASGSAAGTVVNQGSITAQNGDVVLIGQSVRNDGDINAANGTAALAAGNTVLLTTMDGPSGVYVAPGASNPGNVTQTGHVQAAAIALQAAQGNVYTLAGNRTGLVSATGTKTVDGQVWLSAPNGTVSVSGNVRARNADGSGGTIIANGSQVIVGAEANISATGTRGGTVLIGIPALRGSDLDLAMSTTITSGALIRAGGPGGGGTIETSGHLVTIGKADISAGQGGQWKVDPSDLTIDADAADTIRGSLDVGTDVSEVTTATDTSGAGTVSTGAGDIIVDAPITWTGSGSLTLSAYHDIQINQPISGGGGFTGTAGAAVTVGANVSATSIALTAGGGNLTLASGVTLSGTTGIVLRTSGAFINNAGPAALSSTSGNWSVYSTDPADDTTGGLTPDFIQYNASFGDTVLGTGNGLFYTLTPTLTLSSLSGTASASYDGTIPTVTLSSANVTVSGLVNGDTATVTGTFAQADAGMGLTVTTTGTTVAHGTATVYGYAISNPSVSGTIGNIMPKTLTASIVGDPTKVYDKTTTATLTAANYEITGFVGTQSATVNQPSSVSYAGATVGAQTVNATFASSNFIAGSGTNLNNYVMPTTASGMGTIIQAPLVVTGVLAENKVYDKTASDTLDISKAGLYGILSGDMVSLVTTGATGTFSQVNVGSDLLVTASGFALAGTDASNYRVIQPAGLFANITPATLTLTGVTATSRLYDGTTVAGLNTPGDALTGVLGGDTVSLVSTGATGTFATANVGTGIAVAVGGYAINGASASNYTLRQPSGLTADINPAPLTATITDSLSKIYDGNADAGVAAYQISGFIGSEGVTVAQVASLTYATPNAGTQTVTARFQPSDFVGTGSTLLSNYVLPTTATTTGTILQAPISVVIVGNPSKTFDHTTTATLDPSNFVLSGFVTGEGATVTQTVGAYATMNVGVQDVTATLTGHLSPIGATLLSNYSFPTVATGSGTIVPAPLTIGVGPPYDLNGTVSGATKVYDGTTSITNLTSSNFTITGFQGGDGATINQTNGTFGNANAGVEPISVSLSASNYVANPGTNLANYNLPTVVYGSGTITPATVTALIVNDPTKVYDGSAVSILTASDIQFVGFVGTDGVVLPSAVGASYGSASAGSQSVTAPLIPTEMAARSGTILSNYVMPTMASGTGTISLAPLYVVQVSAANKVYDTTAAAGLNTGSATIFGLVSGDSVTLSSAGATGTFAQSTVGNGIAVTATGFAISGGQSADYALVQPTGLTANITPKSIAITGVTAQDKLYDGTTAATLNLASAALSGVYASDSADVILDTSGAHAGFASSNVGVNLPVSDGGFAITGSAAANYSLAQPSGLAATISPAPIIATIVGNPTKVYDGTRSVTLTAASYVLSGFVGTDGATVTVPQSASASYASPNATAFEGATVNSVLVLSDFVAVGSTNLSNYALPTTGTGVGTITQAPITAQIIRNPTKTYDATTGATLTSTNYMLSGFVGSDGATVTQTTGTYGAANAGSESVAAILAAGDFLANSGTDLDNYSLPTTAAGFGTINKAMLTLTGETADNKIYDGTTDATINNQRVTITGLQGSDTVTLLADGTALTLSTGTPVTGNAETGGTFAQKDVGTGVAVTTTGYSISGAAADNYTLEQPATLSADITQKTLTLINVTRVYDALTDLPTSASAYTLSGIVGSDNVTVNAGAITGGSYADKNVGTGKDVTLSNLTLSGTGASNYTIATSLTNDPIGVITPAQLTVTGEVADSKVYDSTTAATINNQKVVFSGLLGSDSVTLNTGSGADKTALTLYDGTTPVTGNAETAGTFAQKDVGTGLRVTATGYSISGTDAGNYTFVQPSSLSADITPATVTVTITGVTKVYDGTNAAPTITSDYILGTPLSGVFAGDDVQFSATNVVGTYSGANVPNVGTGYTITITGGFGLSGRQANDYQITPDHLTVTGSITKAPLTITGKNTSMVYGAGSLPTLDVNYSGFVHGETSAVLTSLPTVTTDATAYNGTAGSGSNVGTYHVTPSGAAAENYDITYANGSLSVTPATLTITGNDASMVYGASSLPTLGFTYGAFANGDTAADLTATPTVGTTATAYNGTAGSGSNVGSYNVTPTGAADGNYTFNYVPGTLTVTPVSLTITANDASMVYGASSLPTLGVSYTGFANGDTAANLGTAPTVTTDATVYNRATPGSGSNVGTYTTTASGAVDGNYTISYVTGSLHVTPADLTIKANDASMVYGASSLPTLGVSYTGLANGDTVPATAPTVTTDATAYNGTAGSGSNVGTYTTTASGAVDGNYNISYATGNLHVTPASLTITGDNASMVYGAGSLPTLGFTYGAFANGDTAADLTATPTVGTTATAYNGTAGSGSNVGTYNVTPTGAADGNYTFNYVPGTLTVTPVSLTITANDASMVYGSESLPTLGVSYTGFANGDTAANLGTTPTVTTDATVYNRATPGSGSNVGTYTTTAAGAVDGNYTISYVTGSLHVTPADLTIKANDASMVYGAGSLPTLGVSYTGLANGDTATTVAPTVTTDATAYNGTAGSGSNVGTYTTTAAGAVDGNYNISYATGNLHVTPATLTITGDNASMVYGAGSLPTLGFTYGAFANGDTAADLTATPTVGTTATAYNGTAGSGSNVGSYNVTPTGAADGNYTFNYVPGTLTVTPVSLTITANDASMVYGASSLPTLGVSYTGFANGDTAANLGTAPTVTTDATVYNRTVAGSGSNVGTYTTTAAGAVDGNYTISYVTGSLHVTPADLTIKANDASMVYGASSLPTLGVSYTGLANGDTAPATAPTVTTDATAYNGTAGSGSNVGTYTTTAAGAVDGNYNISYATGNLHVTPAPLTITANDATMAYGASSLPTFSVDYGGGLVNGDTATTVAPTVGTTATAYNGTAGSGSNAGNYTITASGAVDGNYNITYRPGALRVTPVNLTITAHDASMVYGSGSLPTLGVDYGGGLVNGDTATTVAPTVTTTATAYNGTAGSGSNVGTYAITASGAVDGNYTINYAPGTLHVTPASLIVTAGSPTMVYGAASLPTLGVSYTGLANGDTAPATAPTVGTTATAYNGTAGSGSNVGTYTTTASGAVDGNYDITYRPGALSVTPASLTITANDATMAYGASSLPTLGLTYGAFANGDTAASLTTAPTVGTTATAYNGTAGSGSNAGAYAVTPTGAVDGNYTFNYMPGTLTVTPVSLTITADSPTMVYGASLPTLGVSYTGLVNGDTATTTAPTVTTTARGYNGTAGSGSNVGTYTTTASGAADGNYNITYVTGSLSVTPASLIVTADSASMVYGAASLPTLGVAYTGLANGDTAPATAPTVTTTATAYNGTAGSGSNVGTYATTASGAADGNYNITYRPGALRVTPATLTITGNDATMVYGAASLPTLGFTYGAFANGDTSAVMTTAPTVGTTATAYNGRTGSDVGSYAVTPTGAAAANYNITYVAGSLRVTPAPLSIAIVGDPSKSYDGTTAATLTAINYAITGLAGGQGITVNQGAGLYAGPNAGTEAVTARLASGNFTAMGSTKLSNYILPTVATGSGTINRRVLTAAITGTPTKVNDGTTAATLTSGDYALTGFVNGQGATITQTSGTYATADTGSQTVTASLAASDFLANAGTLLSNYVLPMQATGPGLIRAAIVTNANSLAEAISANLAIGTEQDAQQIVTETLKAVFVAATPRTFIPFYTLSAFSTWQGNGFGLLPTIIQAQALDTDMDQDTIVGGPPILNTTEQILLQGDKDKSWRITIRNLHQTASNSPEAPPLRPAL